MDNTKPTPPALRKLLDEALQARARGDHAQAGQLAVHATQMDANCAEAHYLAGLAFQNNSSAVATAQVREGMHRRAVGRWEKFRPWLGELEELLRRAGIDPGTGTRN